MSAFAFSANAFADARAEIYRHLDPTPQINWPQLSARCGAEIWLKHENHLPTGSFKVRGGLLYARHLAEQREPPSSVIAATRGNHGQSVAFAAQRYAQRAVVVVPHGNNPDKNAAMRAWGAELIEHGDDFDTALAHAQALASTRGLAFFPSFDPLLVCGVGTYAVELLEALPDLDRVYVPIGLGSGICGMIAARDALRRKTEIVGVVAARADAYAQSFRSGVMQTTATAQTMADGLAVRQPDARALAIIRAGAADVVTVEEDAIADAVGMLFTTTHQCAEGAAAASLAACLQRPPGDRARRIALVLSGGNIDSRTFATILAERVAPAPIG